MYKTLFISIALLLFTADPVICQTDSAYSYSLIKGKIISIETQEPIQNATVTIIGTDSSSRSFEASDSGLFEVRIKPGIKYLVTINAKGYLNSRGKEYVEEGGIAISHLYEMFTLLTCRGSSPDRLYYAFNDFEHPFKKVDDDLTINGMARIMTSNPKLIIEVVGYRDFNEDTLMGLRRVKYVFAQLIKQGVSQSRLIAVDKKNTSYWTNEELKDKSDQPPNRIVLFRITEILD